MVGWDLWPVPPALLAQFVSENLPYSRKLVGLLAISTVLFPFTRIFGACGGKQGTGVNQSHHKSVNSSATTEEEQGQILLGELQLI